mmetsp:Transcript_85912/g.185477  ORF Transcript_85912/g.185477 Transcript_85912/m.185477 type:complete len:234 (-) Transcript_85912:182-883(-)
MSLSESCRAFFPAAFGGPLGAEMSLSEAGSSFTPDSLFTEGSSFTRGSSFLTLPRPPRGGEMSLSAPPPPLPPDFLRGGALPPGRGMSRSLSLPAAAAGLAPPPPFLPAPFDEAGGFPPLAMSLTSRACGLPDSLMPTSNSTVSPTPKLASCWERQKQSTPAPYEACSSWLSRKPYLWEADFTVPLKVSPVGVGALPLPSPLVDASLFDDTVIACGFPDSFRPTSNITDCPTR